MPGYYEIRWLPDGRTEKFAGSRGHYYEFSESDRLEFDAGPVWCHRCGTITHGESLSTIEEIDQQIRDLGDPSSELFSMTQNSLLAEMGHGEEFRREQITELQRRRRWRESRKSPPRCIQCGTTEILPLPLGVPVPNPLGKGEIQIDCIGIFSTDFTGWFFTPEGDRIQRDARPM